MSESFEEWKMQSKYKNCYDKPSLHFATAAYEAGRQVEREKCARIAEDMDYDVICSRIAAAIREDI